MAEPPPPYPPYGQPPYGQMPPYQQPPYQQPPYGQPPYGQPPYGQVPYGAPPGGLPPYYQQLAPKPGCIPLRPLGLGDILSGAFSAVFRNARVVLPLSAVVAVLQATIGVIIQLQLSGPTSQPLVDNSDPNNPVFHWRRIQAFLATAGGGSLLSAVFAAVLTGMLIVVVTEDVVGRRADFGLVWRKVRSRLGRLVGLSLLVSITQSVGLLFCLAPGIWLWGIWAVAIPAMMIENTGVGGALGRSKQLVDGMFWRVWGIRALGYLIAGAISAVIGLVFSTVVVSSSDYHPGGGVFSSTGGTALSAGAVLVLGLGSAIAAMLTTPVKAAVDSLLYVDQRMRKENLAVDLQAAAANVRRLESG